MAVAAGTKALVRPPYSKTQVLLSRFSEDGVSADLDLLHPGAIWNRSSLPVIRALEHVTGALPNLPADCNMETEEWQEILLWQDRTLRALHQALDAAYLVLIACSSTAKPKAKPGTTNHHWLGAAHEGIRDTFHIATKSIRADLEIVNKMKHSIATLSPFRPENVQGPLPSYYFQGVSRKGGMGPDPVCNPAATAFSFSRDIRVRILQFHLIDGLLADCAQTIFAETGRSLVDPHGKLLDGHERWKALLDFAARLPPWVLPDEGRKPLPVVSALKGGVYEIEAKPRSGRPLPLTKAKVAMSGDGMTCSGRLPYPPSENGNWDLDASF